MKQLFLGLSLSFALGTQVYAVDVPKAVLKAFTKMYSDLEDEPEWDYFEEDDLYVAFFDNDGYLSEAHFRPNGTWVKTSTTIGAIDLPEKLMTYFSEEYPDVDDFIASIKEEEPSLVQFFITFEYNDEVYTLVFDEQGNKVDF